MRRALTASLSDVTTRFTTQSQAGDEEVPDVRASQSPRSLAWAGFPRPGEGTHGPDVGGQARPLPLSS